MSPHTIHKAAGEPCAVMLEDGRPLIAFPERPAGPGWVEVWSPIDGTAPAQALYLEGLPEAPPEVASAALAHYARTLPVSGGEQ